MQTIAFDCVLTWISSVEWRRFQMVSLFLIFKSALISDCSFSLLEYYIHRWLPAVPALSISSICSSSWRRLMIASTFNDSWTEKLMEYFTRCNQMRPLRTKLVPLHGTSSKETCAVCAHETHRTDIREIRLTHIRLLNSVHTISSSVCLNQWRVKENKLVNAFETHDKKKLLPFTCTWQFN